MSELAKAPGVEKTQVLFSTRVIQAFNSVGEELGNCPPAFTAIAAPALDRIRSGKKYPKLVYFDEGGKTYRYSAELRRRRGLVPLDAMYLAEGENSLFMQISHSVSSSSDLRGEVELIMGKERYVGERALDKAHEAFPRFYPASEALRKVA